MNITSEKKKTNHDHLFITGLIYPGFLGAFIIDTANILFKASDIQLFLLLALAWHYIGDYLATADGNCKKIYNRRRMLIDLCLVVLIFMSFSIVIDSTPTSTYQDLCLCLGIFKVLNIVWEFSGEKDHRFLSGILTDVVFLMLYVFWSYLVPSCAYVLGFIILLDASMYFFWDKTSQVIDRKSS